MDSWNWKGEQPTLLTEEGRHSDCTSCHESDLMGKTVHIKASYEQNIHTKSSRTGYIPKMVMLLLTDSDIQYCLGHGMAVVWCWTSSVQWVSTWFSNNCTPKQSSGQQ